MSKPRNHFIGSVVTQQVLTSPEGTSRHTLIDGQQRMTTLFVILGVIQQKAKQEAYDDLAEEIRYSCLLNQFGKGEERTKLMPTQRDREAFALMMNGEIPTDRSQIAKARDYFEEALRGGDADGGRGGVNEIDFRKLYRSTVLHLDMVSILLEGDDSPNRIFESLNNTGMPLSVADLIRNYSAHEHPGYGATGRSIQRLLVPDARIACRWIQGRSWRFFLALLNDGWQPNTQGRYI